MKASLLDLRRRTGKIVAAIEQQEEVTLSKRGRRIAKIVPYAQSAPTDGAVAEHAAFGMWAPAVKTNDVPTQVRKMREGRFRDL